MRPEHSLLLQDIFRPTGRKLVLASLLAAGWHVFFTFPEVRAWVGQRLYGLTGFWSDSLQDGLTYLETDSLLLKFLTFFVVSYLAVWLLSKSFRVFERLELLTIKRLRRNK